MTIRPLAVMVLLFLAVVVPASSGATNPPRAPSSFDDDGYADLVVGVPYSVSHGAHNAGTVNVLYGSSSGLSDAGNQMWHQDSEGIKGDPEPQEKFGHSLAVGDFDADTYFDLAVGVPFDRVGSVDGAGSVNVLRGSSDGLSALGDQLWNQQSDDIVGIVETDDAFGYAVATGDFDSDGYSDLAVGVPCEDLGSLEDAGVVNILYGSANGLSATGNQMWHQDSDDIAGIAEQNDGFGQAVATGDFDADGYSDLAIGVPARSPCASTAGTGGGVVNVLYGSSAGLSSTGNQVWEQNTPGIVGTGEPWDQFGHALVTGDFDGDGYADLAVGVPHEDLGSLVWAGVVNILYGSASGLSAAGNQMWHQDSDDIQEEAGTEDRFGSALAAGNFDGDFYGDLAIGVPGEDFVVSADGGAVHVLYGSSDGLLAYRNQMLIRGPTLRADEDFGYALAAAQFNNDRYTDLAVGAPGADVDCGAGGTREDGGRVRVFYGRNDGFTNADGPYTEWWDRCVPGVEGTAHSWDDFGRALTAYLPCQPLTDVSIPGGTTGIVGVAYGFCVDPEPSNATTPYVVDWSPEPFTGQGGSCAWYIWDAPGAKQIEVAMSNCGGTGTAGDIQSIDIAVALRLPLIMKDS
jgi:hypothetical protein